MPGFLTEHDAGVSEPVGRGLLEAISEAVRVLDGSGDDEHALRHSFRLAARGLHAERAFLARVEARRWVSGVLDAIGLEGDELAAIESSRSSPGLSLSLVQHVLETGRTAHVEDARLVPATVERTESLLGGAWSVVCAPVLEPRSRVPVAVLYFQTNSLTRPLHAAVLPHVHSYALALSCVWYGWTRGRREIEAVRHELAAARADLEDRGTSAVTIVGVSDATAALRLRLETVILPALRSPRPLPVLILGETGCGKDLVARYLHARSPRARGPFVVLNCGSLRGDLAASTLFGHAKGSFTGASRDAEGVFGQAHGGVLFLDEVGDMPWDAQVMLLRAIENRVVRSVGGDQEREIDVQVVLATNVNLPTRVERRRFRADLYERIKTLRVQVVPLRDRPADVAPLAEHFLAQHERDLARRTGGLTPEARAALEGYRWPGNARELSGVCLALVLHTRPGQRIGIQTVRSALPEIAVGAERVSPQEGVLGLLERPFSRWHDAALLFEGAYLQRVGQDVAWNRSAMSRRLGVDRKSIYRRLERHGLLGIGGQGPGGDDVDRENEEDEA